jgi:hypothetical protein
MNKLNITYEILYNEYINNKKSMKTIAKENGVTTMAIFHRLKKYKIPTRTSWEVLIGKKRPEHSKALKGRKNPKLSEIRKTRVGILAPNYKGGEFLKQHYCKCGRKISYKTWKNGLGQCQSCANRTNMTGKKLAEETKEKLRITSSGKNNAQFGKTMKPTWGEYNKIWFRSNWEILYAKYLDNNNIGWLYEPKTFDLKTTTYTPDFYLPEKDLYIEIKGYFSDLAKAKINKFKKMYKNIKLEILTKPELQKIGVIK